MRSVVVRSLYFFAVAASTAGAIAQTPPSEPGQTVGWSDERELSAGSGPIDLAFNFARAIAVDSADRVHVVWYERREGKECACYRRSTDAGKTWQDVLFLSDASEPMPESAVLPTVAASGNDVYAAWHEKSQKDGMNVRLRHSGDGGKTWQPAVNVSRRKGVSAHATLAASGDSVHVAWGDHREGDVTEIYYARSTDKGITWEEERRLTEQPHDSWVPSLAAGGDDVVLAWVDTRDGNEEEYVRVSRDAGRTWAPQVRLTDHAAKSWAPSVLVAGGTIHFAWFDQKHAPRQPEEAEAVLDEAMKLVGLPDEPAPRGLRVPHPEEAAKRRATAKLKQIHAAADDLVVGGGDPTKLQDILREFQEMGKPVKLPEADRKLDEALELIGVELPKTALPTDDRGWQARLQGKLERIHEEGPKWVKAGGDERQLKTLLEAFQRQVKDPGAASYMEKERKLDQAMRLLGLTYLPGPDGDGPTIYFTETAPFRVRDKLRQVQAAAPDFAKRGGDSAKLQGLLAEFEKRMRLASTEWEVYYRSSRDGGKTWTPEARLTEAPGISMRPSLVADGNDLYVSWWDSRDGNTEIYMKRSPDAGHTWGRDQRITRTAGESTKPSLAVSRDFLHLVWLDARDGSPKIYYRRAARPVAE